MPQSDFVSDREPLPWCLLNERCGTAVDARESEGHPAQRSAVGLTQRGPCIATWGLEWAAACRSPSLLPAPHRRHLQSWGSSPVPQDLPQATPSAPVAPGAQGTGSRASPRIPGAAALLGLFQGSGSKLWPRLPGGAAQHSPQAGAGETRGDRPAPPGHWALLSKEGGKDTGFQEPAVHPAIQDTRRSPRAAQPSQDVPGGRPTPSFCLKQCVRLASGGLCREGGRGGVSEALTPGRRPARGNAARSAGVRGAAGFWAAGAKVLR